MKSLILILSLIVVTHSHAGTDYAHELADSWNVHELEHQRVVECIDEIDLDYPGQTIETCKPVYVPRSTEFKATKVPAANISL